MYYSDYLNTPEMIIAKSRDFISLTCSGCEKTFSNKKHQIQNKASKNYEVFCSRKCNDLSRRKRISVNCGTCNKQIECTPHTKLNSKSGEVFCSQTCSATYQNSHKSYGYRRSKLEVWLERKLKEQYPELIFVFNGKEVILSELDIYIPNLKLAFELNGIFHYEPIFGANQLDKIQNNDNRKFQACLEAGIELCIIDSSSQKHFTELSSQKYMNIITTIINTKLL